MASLIFFPLKVMQKCRTIECRTIGPSDYRQHLPLLLQPPSANIYIFLFLTIILRRHDTKNYFVFIPCLSLILTKVSDNTAQLETKTSAGSLLQRVPTVNEIRIMCHFFYVRGGYLLEKILGRLIGPIILINLRKKWK